MILCGHMFFLLGWLLLLTPLNVQASRFHPGTVIKGEGRSALFVVQASGHLAHIPSVQALRCLELHRQPPQVVPALAVDNLPKSPLLVRSPDGHIFRIEGVVKRHIQSPAVWQRLGYPAASILAAGEAQLRCLADGPPVD